MSNSKTVVVCQGKSCLQRGAQRVLETFRRHGNLDLVQVVATRCLGECGNGPMVLILPDQVWYSRVLPDEVPAVIRRHLIQGRPVRSMLYRKFHPR